MGDTGVSAAWASWAAWYNLLDFKAASITAAPRSWPSSEILLLGFVYKNPATSNRDRERRVGVLIETPQN